MFSSKIYPLKASYRNQEPFKKGLLMAKKLLKRMLQKKNIIIKNLTGMKYLSVFSPNAGKCGKNEDQNNSEYGHFLRSASDRETGLIESNRDVLEADNKTLFLIGRSSRRSNNAQQKIYNLVRIIVDILFYKGFGFRLMRRNCNII